MKKCLRKKCQKEFEPNKPKQVYCSAKCRVYANRDKKALLQNAGITEAKKTENKVPVKNNSNIPPMPVKSDYPDSFQFAAAKNEWKIKYNQ